MAKNRSNEKAAKEAEETRIADQDGGKDRPPVNSPLGTQDVGSPAWNAAYDEENTKKEAEANETISDDDADDKKKEKAKEKLDEVEQKRVDSEEQKKQSQKIAKKK